MDHKAIFKLCKDQGCCDACAVRYLGVKNQNVYEDLKKHISKYQETPTESSDPQPLSTEPTNGTTECANTNQNIEGSATENGQNTTNGSNGSPASKRRRTEACVSCLGVLEEETWPECNDMVKEMMDKKNYDCRTFACALSAPIATLLRERVLALRIQDAFPNYDPGAVTPLKEAWKWSYGPALARHLALAQDSGAVCPLLLTLALEYPHEAKELELLKSISPELFESRSKQKRRFAVEFTRRSAELALDAPAHNIKEAGRRLAAAARVRCVSVAAARHPALLAGRYVKLSRELPQTPWVVAGRRMLPSSVQEIIFEPLARALGIPPAEAEHRLKFMSAGREDVDVRCLGQGRPFAVEVADPRRVPSAEELRAACAQISRSGTVIVNEMCVVSKEELAVLKQGEQSKSKTYEALCIKLSHADHETHKTPSDPITVTATDIENMNSYRNTPAGHRAAVLTSQRTPIRVLHRRPLLARDREILEMKADVVPGHPQLFTLRVRTSAGTYVKEWAHGELGRSRPALGIAARARVDLLALDVAAVHLDWPANR